MYLWALAALIAVVGRAGEVICAGAGAARLVCYIQDGTGEFGGCTHLVYSGAARGSKLEGLLKELRENNPRVKMVVRVNADDKDFAAILKSKHVQGLEIFDAHKTLNRTKIVKTVESAKTAVSKSGGGPVLLALPAHPELLAKYYDLRALVKTVDLMMLQTHELGVVNRMTYHPSRLSGLWDMMNTDSVVDLAVGLGIPASKVVISLPATARQFTLSNATLSTPGSPTLEDQPQEIDQAALCQLLSDGRWTLERDQDLSAPYAFKNTTWVSFEDSSSVDVKGKYARVRGLAGLALAQADRDETTKCGPTLRASLAKVLNSQSRAPRAAVLRSLENEILSSGAGPGRALDALQLSPYRITQVVDSDGVIHSIREDTRTEFSCSRQGYFVHPRSCARFYRCVKFDQLSPEYTVFEFDCPAGLAFDARYEVCVWPGSLPHSQACPGSSEIAPVPHTRFVCPEHEGYYADPENCRWFFACLDHGKAPLSAYEFRCPFGLGFDAGRLQCDWPWLVPACGNIARYEAEAHGFSAAILTGAAGFQGQTADAVNIAAHRSLVSGASLDNLVGVQAGFLSQHDALDGNFITSQEYANGALGHSAGLGSSQVGHSGLDIGTGLVNPTQYRDSEKYTSGSLILDEYRLPTKGDGAHKFAAGYNGNAGIYSQNNQGYGKAYNAANLQSNLNINHQNGFSGSHYQGDDNSGAYVHDPTGDRAEPYKHIDAPAAPYVHDDSAYKDRSNYYNGYGKSDAAISGYEGNYAANSGQYVNDNSGSYHNHDSQANGGYRADYEGSYTNDDSGKYVAGIYRHGSEEYTGLNGDAGSNYRQSSNGESGNAQIQHYNNGYSNGYGDYVSGSAYSGASHSLTAGAINVGLVGKTTLVDSDYLDQTNFASGVAVTHLGSDVNSQNINHYVTTPTTSGVPTTASPVSVTTYKTKYVQEQPKSSLKDVIYRQPAITHAQPTVVAFKQEYITPKVDLTDYNQGVVGQYSYSSGYEHNAAAKTESVGYDYSKPAVKFEDGINTHTTAVPILLPTVSTNIPHAYNQQTIHESDSGYDYHASGLAIEEPFKKVIAYTTGEPSYASQTVSSTPHSYNHQTIHRVETGNVNTYSPAVSVDTNVGYEYQRPSIEFHETPKSVQYTTPHAYSHQTIHKVETAKVDNYSPAVAVSDNVGYEYSQPTVHLHHEAPVEYTTAQPHAYSHQTIHKVETAKVENNYSPSVAVPDNVGYTYSQPSVEFQDVPKLVEYTTAQPNPHAYSHQTIHKVETAKVENNYAPSVAVSENVGYEYSQPTVHFHEVPKSVEYTTVQPHAYSHQTIHKVETAKVENNYAPSVVVAENVGYKYSQPTVHFHEVPKSVEYTTAQPHAYSHQTIHKVETAKVENNYAPSVVVAENVGYKYSQPTVHFHEVPKSVEYTTAQPHAYSHQTIHKVETAKVENNYAPSVVVAENVGYKYSQPTVHFHEVPKSVEYTTAQPHAYSHQTIHKVETAKVENNYSPSVAVADNIGYTYSQPSVEFHNVPKSVEYTTAQPNPHAYSHQTIHKVEAAKIENNYTPSVAVSENVGYEYSQPSVNFHEQPKSTPNAYSQQTIHKVEADKTYTYSPAEVEYSKPAITVQETYEPQVYNHQNAHNVQFSHVDHQTSVGTSESSGYDYAKPSVNFEESFVEYTTAQPSISTYKPHAYSHQTIHKTEEQKIAPIIVSSTPLPQVEYRQPAVTVYENPLVQYNQKQSSVLSQDNNQHVQSYEPAIHQHEVKHIIHDEQNIQINQAAYAYPEIQRDIENHNSGQHYYSQQQAYQQTVAQSDSSEKDKNVVFVSTSPSTLIYEDHYTEYESPKTINAYKAPEYIPPRKDIAEETSSVLNHQQHSVIHKTQHQYDYKPVEYSEQYDATPKSVTPIQQISFSTTHEQPRQIVESVHFSSHPTSTYKPISYESPEIQIGYKAEEYLPPVLSTPRPVITTYKPRSYVRPTVTTLQYLPPSPEPKYTASEYLPPSSTIRPIIVKSTKQFPTYKYEEVSTPSYKAPEYLPPLDATSDSKIVNFESFGLKNVDKLNDNAYEEYSLRKQGSPVVVSSTSLPIQRKHNIVVETSKSHLLGFGTVGPDAGLVTPDYYTTSAPAYAQTYSTPRRVTPTYAPIKQETIEVTASPIPVRRTKPKVAVVTKINDFNPLLVRKLGAVCSCQSPVLVLKGRRPNVQVQQDYDVDYDGNDYEESERGDIGKVEFEKISRRQKSESGSYVTISPVAAHSINPIIVPEDSYYQDYQERDASPQTKEYYSQSFASSTPASSERTVKIRPRARYVTAAPTYKTVLVQDTITPVPLAKDSSNGAIDSQSFDRYGPGGLRSRDETLQGSVDCQRAGLFRHPKQCNKFYACRWDDTKQRFTLHVFNCPVQLSFDPSLGACNWPSQGPACQGDTLLTNTL